LAPSPGPALVMKKDMSACGNVDRVGEGAGVAATEAARTMMGREMGSMGGWGGGLETA
jgi:hypothetical protein